MEALKKLLAERFNLSNTIGAAMIRQQEATEARDKIDARIDEIVDPRMLVASTLEFKDLPVILKNDPECLYDMIENEPGYSDKIEQLISSRSKNAGSF